MRWHPNPPQALADPPWWLSGLLFLLFSPVIAIGATLIGLLWLKRWLMGPTEAWRPWFAWFPVTVKPWPDEERVWLEWVERRSGHLFGDGEYRTKEPRP